MKNKTLTFCILVFLSFGVYSLLAKPDPTWQDFFRNEGAQWRVNPGTNKVFSMYGRGKSFGSSAQSKSSQILVEYGKLFGIEDPSSLQFVNSNQNATAKISEYRQTYGGLPVVGSEILIVTGKDHRLLGVSSNYFRGLSGEVLFRTDPKRAEHSIAKRFKAPITTTFKGLWIVPFGNQARAAWKIEAESENFTEGSWVFYVDAVEPEIILRKSKTMLNFEGQGTIWLENPVVTPQRTSQTLLNMDASRSLTGKFAKTFNANFIKSVNFLDPILSKYTTARSNTRTFNFPEDDGRLAEAMAYYHMNRVHERWKSLGFTKLDARVPAFVNVATYDGGPGWDNAAYSRSKKFPKTGLYIFGAGDRYENTGFDGDIYYHEYGHGVLDRIKPGMIEAVESAYPFSIHEALGDISAVALSGNSKFAEFGFRLKDNKRFEGRNLNNNKKYPKDVVWPFAGFSEPHYTCLIAGGAWWDLQKMVGILTAQKIFHDALYILPNESNFFHVRDAMITTDNELFQGSHRIAIEQAFARHGISGPNKGQTGKITISGITTAGGANTADPRLTTTFSRGDTIYLVVNYSGRNLVPGYYSVPAQFEFQKPSGTAPQSAFLISEVFNGNHSGLDGLFMMEILTDGNTAAGTYTIEAALRLGGTTLTSPKQSVTFSLN